MADRQLQEKKPMVLVWEKWMKSVLASKSSGPVRVLGFRQLETSTWFRLCRGSSSALSLKALVYRAFAGPTMYPCASGVSVAFWGVTCFDRKSSKIIWRSNESPHLERTCAGPRMNRGNHGTINAKSTATRGNEVATPTAVAPTARPAGDSTGPHQTQVWYPTQRDGELTLQTGTQVNNLGSSWAASTA